MNDLGFTIPQSIRKPVSGPCEHCGEDSEDWCKWNQCWLHDDCADKLTREQEADHRADDPRRGQAEWLNK